MGSLRSFWLLLVFASCAGPCSDTAGDHVGPPEQPGDFVATEHCSAVSWDGEQSVFYNCERETSPSIGAWTCDCDATGAGDEEPAQGECKAALMTECGATDDDVVSCSVHDVGACVPDPDGEWTCACTDEDTLTPTEGTSCERAIWAHCGGACEGTLGTCSGGGEVHEYVCHCAYYDATRSVYDRTCEGALDAVCRPGSRTCTAFQGYCDETPQKGGYECGCVDGTVGVRTYEQLEYDDCRLALEEICGAEVSTEDICEDELDDGRQAECVRNASTMQFSCSCHGDGDSVSGDLVDAPDCATALEQACNP